jgi:hypothetical protein
MTLSDGRILGIMLVCYNTSLSLRTPSFIVAKSGGSCREAMDLKEADAKSASS